MTASRAGPVEQGHNNPIATDSLNRGVHGWVPERFGKATTLKGEFGRAAWKPVAILRSINLLAP